MHNILALATALTILLALPAAAAPRTCSHVNPTTCFGDTGWFPSDDALLRLDSSSSGARICRYQHTIPSGTSHCYICRKTTAGGDLPIPLKSLAEWESFRDARTRLGVTCVVDGPAPTWTVTSSVAGTPYPDPNVVGQTCVDTTTTEACTDVPVGPGWTNANVCPSPPTRTTTTSSCMPDLVTGPQCGTGNFDCAVGSIDWNSIQINGGVYAWDCEDGGNTITCSSVQPPACDRTHYSCRIGTSSNNVADTSEWTWDCANGGTTISCSEPTAAPQCGAAQYTCVVGVDRPMSSLTEYLWECYAGGTHIECSAPFDPPPECGATHYNCTSGTAYAETQTTSGWTWGCMQNSQTVQCSESSAPAPACGATHYNCSVGTASAQNQGASEWTWSCDSGGNSASCSEARGAVVNGACNTAGLNCVTGSPGPLSRAIETSGTQERDVESWMCLGSGGGSDAACERNGPWRSVGTCVPSWSAWSPSASFTCLGQSFTQTRSQTNCPGLTQQTRSSTGSKASQWRAWSPSCTTIAQGVNFTQTRTDSTGCQPTGSQQATGCDTTPPPCVDSWGQWGPGCTSTPVGSTFTQSRTYTGTCTPRPADQTRSGQAGCDNTPPCVDSWGSWGPGCTSTPVGSTFSQSRTYTGTCTPRPADQTRSGRAGCACTDSWSGWTPGCSGTPVGSTFMQSRSYTGTCTPQPPDQTRSANCSATIKMRT